jgi:hypothetical protein
MSFRKPLNAANLVMLENSRFCNNLCILPNSDVFRFPAKVEANGSSPICLFAEIKKELKTNDYELDANAMASCLCASFESIC